MRSLILVFSCLLLPVAAGAETAVQEPPAAEVGAATYPDNSGQTSAAPRAEPPPLPEEEAELQPEVVIRKRGSNTVEEYRINGRLYKVRVKPPGGAPYFLIDTDGDGLMDTRRTDLNAEIVVPQWVLFRW